MPLIVENGDIVANANSYVSRADLIAYAMLRGVVLPNTDATDVLAIKGMDYLALFDQEWRGAEVEPGVQPLAWPRMNVYPNGNTPAYADDAVPPSIVRAQCELAMNVNAGTILLPTTSAQTAFITKEKVDVIETEYSEAIAIRLMGMLPQMPLVSSLLSPWLKPAGFLKTRRV